jgi:hypothetical protein
MMTLSKERQKSGTPRALKHLPADAVDLSFQYNDQLFSHTFNVRTNVLGIRTYLAELNDIRVVFLGRGFKDRFAIRTERADGQRDQSL